MSQTVSIHPYFKAHEGQLETFRSLCPAFVEKTATEEACQYYDFTFNGDEIHCREGYIGAAGVLAHLENVGELLQQALQNADLTRLEIHGPADELEKLKEPLAALSPAYFVHECGVVK